jgi:hypothetical protein
MVKKNTSIELASANVKRHGLYVVHISLCNVPSIVSLIGVTFVKELTLMKLLLFIVFTVIGGFISFCVNVSS